MKNYESQEKYAERLNAATKRRAHCGIGRFVNHKRFENEGFSAHVSGIAKIDRLVHRSWRLMQELSETNKQLNEAFCKYVSCQHALQGNQCCSSRFPRRDGKNRRTVYLKNPMRPSHWTQFGSTLEEDYGNRWYWDALSQL